MTIATLAPAPAPRIEFDHAVLTRICARHGAAAESYLAALLGEIEGELARLAVHADRAEYAGIETTCGRLLDLAERIGMTTLGTCTRAVLDCLRDGDGTALSACLARLLRLSEPESLRGWAVTGAPAA